MHKGWSATAIVLWPLTAVLCQTAPIAGQAPIITATLACSGVDMATAPHLQLTLHNNSGEADTALEIGSVRANGQNYLPRVTLHVHGTGQAAAEVFDYFDPAFPGIAGRADPWIVPLPAGSAYSLRLELRHFFSRSTAKWLDPKNQRLAVELHLSSSQPTDVNLDMTGLKLMQIWSGALVSNQVRLPEDCRTASNKALHPTAAGGILSGRG